MQRELHSQQQGKQLKVNEDTDGEMATPQESFPSIFPSFSRSFSYVITQLHFQFVHIIHLDSTEWWANSQPSEQVLYLKSFPR